MEAAGNPDSLALRIRDALRELTPAQREVELLRRCAGDRELQDAVELLLADATEGAAVADPPTGATTRVGIVTDWQRQREAAWRGKLIGDYEVTGVLGQGGMGLVLAARHQKGGPEVALKQVRPDLVSPNLLRRLERERDVLLLLRHPNIVSFSEMGLTAEGTPYVVMEKIDGVALDEAIIGKPLAVRVRLLRDVAFSVGHAHARAIVHRDLKPSNIMVTAASQVKLLDFGIAKVLEDESASALTATGDRMLTPRYAAPEQHLGQATSPATDVFALGVILDEITVIRALDDPGPVSPAATRAPTGDDPDATSPAPAKPRPSSAAQLQDVWLDQIIAHCRAEQPDQRYANATELAEDLEAWLDGRQPQVCSRRARLQRFVRAHRAQVRIAGAVALLLLITLPGFFLTGGRDPTVIDNGYQLLESDLVGMSGETRQAVRDAITADAHGDRERAIALMRSADANAGENAVPAILLLAWESGRGNDTSELQRRAQSLLRRRPDPYLELLLRSFSAPTDKPAESIREIKASLSLRPRAWRQQLALAHRYIAYGNDELALQALQQIDTGQIDDRRAGQILIDRALLGDAAGAQAQLPRMPAAQRNWSRLVEVAIDHASGRPQQALEKLRPLTSDAIADAEPETYTFARLAQMISLGEMRNWQELGEVGSGQFRHGQARGNPSEALVGAMMVMMADAKLGDRDGMRAALVQANSVANDPLPQADVALLGAQLGELIDHRDRLMARFSPDDPYSSGLPSLLAAADAVASGDPVAARSALQRARREGILQTRFASSARWFARACGQDWGAPVVRLPLWYFPYSRWMPRWFDGPAAGATDPLPVAPSAP